MGYMVIFNRLLEIPNAALLLPLIVHCLPPGNVEFMRERYSII